MSVKMNRFLSKFAFAGLVVLSSSAFGSYPCSDPSSDPIFGPATVSYSNCHWGGPINFPTCMCTETSSKHYDCYSSVTHQRTSYGTLTTTTNDVPEAASHCTQD